MVVKMMKWSPWQQPPSAAARRFQVTVNRIKLEGFDGDEKDADRDTEKVMVIEMKWKGGPRTGGLVPLNFNRTSSAAKRRKHLSTTAAVKNGEPVEWDDEFENVCSFPISSKESNSFGPWDASFTLLYGLKTEGKSRMAVVGKLTVNLAEMASKMEAFVEKKFPINLQVAGVAREAVLSMCFSLVEVRNSQDSAGMGQSVAETTRNDESAYKDEDFGESETHDCKAEVGVTQGDSDDSSVFDKVGSAENESVVEAYSGPWTKPGLNSTSETKPEPVKKAGFFSWKRRRLSFAIGRRKVDPSNEMKDNGKKDVDEQGSGSVPVDSVTPFLERKSEEALKQDGSSTEGEWEVKELVSRDGQTRLKAAVFLASFDQCSNKAAGESACTALVAVITNWLHSNPNGMPTKSEFDSLIVEGSSEWRKLCSREDLLNQFPDKHFDLETVLEADLRPVAISPEKSFIGFFGPEKFECLKEFGMSFDQIWDQISSRAENSELGVYIVTWNDHFFVLKVEADAYYIIDTLGERLFESCNQAFILRFDDSATIHGKKINRETAAAAKETAAKSKEEGGEMIIYRGKECCREFIKRFLAAIPLAELEIEERKEPVPYLALHRQLQIEVDLTSPFSSSSSSSSSTSSSASSPFNNIMADLH